MRGVSSLNIQWLKKKSGLGVVSPFSSPRCQTSPSPRIDKLYGYKNSRQFETDLDWLLRNFRPLSLDQVAEQAQRRSPFRGKRISDLL
ncbi:hypothetical protein ACQ86N_06105 [Puia sp. P3]|uniref:hypothetical protein n=1 Tax=Puia sp. P3 TaxID=3423952 RepID=UPI003D66D81B